MAPLDAQTRYAMEEEILRIWETEKRTVIFVTNNIEEAVTLGDRVIQFTERPARVKRVYDLKDLYLAKKPCVRGIPAHPPGNCSQ